MTNNQIFVNLTLTKIKLHLTALNLKNSGWPAYKLFVDFLAQKLRKTF